MAWYGLVSSRGPIDPGAAVGLGARPADPFCGVCRGTTLAARAVEAPDESRLQALDTMRERFQVVVTPEISLVPVKLVPAKLVASGGPCTLSTVGKKPSTRGGSEPWK